MPKMTEEQKEVLNRQLDDYVDSGFGQTFQWITLWQDAMDYVFGNQLQNRDRKGWERAICNYISPALAQIRAIIGQRNPSIVAQAVNPDGDALKHADLWTGLLQYQFKENLKARDFMLRSLLDAQLFGYAVAMTVWEDKPNFGWDDEQKKWIGKPETRLIHPQYFAADPEAETLDDASYIVTRRKIPVIKAIERWPQFRQEIIDAAAIEYDELFNRLGRASMMPQYDNKPTIYSAMQDEARMVNLILMRASGRDFFTDSDMRDVESWVTIEQIFFLDSEERKMWDDERIPEDELMAQGLLEYDPETQLPRDPVSKTILTAKNWPSRSVNERMEPKYPYGRYILRIGQAQNKHIILNFNTEDQVWPYKKWPFAILVNDILPHMWQGLNGVENARFLQNFTNQTMSHILNWLKNFCDPHLKAEEGCIADSKSKKQFSTEPGAIWWMKEGRVNAAQYEHPPELPSAAMSVYELIGREMRDQLGMQALGLGRESGGVKSATEAQHLAMNSTQRTALLSDLTDAYLIEIGKMHVIVDKYHMEDGDSINILSDDQVLASKMIEDALKTPIHLTLDTTNAAPFDKDRKRQDLVQVLSIFKEDPIMYQIMLPRVLKTFDIADADTIVEEYKRMQQNQQAIAATMQAQQHGGQPQPPQPGVAPVQPIQDGLPQMSNDGKMPYIPDMAPETKEIPT